MIHNRYEYNGWVLEKVQDFSILQDFDCGDSDLNEYYHTDVLRHQRELLTQTYCFYRQGESALFSRAFIDFCNDAVRLNKLTENELENIPLDKRHYTFFPAVKITRLGVDVAARNLGIGSLLLVVVKRLFLHDNRTGCRFLTVDAYNKPEVLRFYTKNAFEYLELRPSQRKDRRQIPMVFDLKHILPDDSI